MYCTKEDLIAAFGEAEILRLTANDGEIDKAIADAKAEIDMYLADRYVLPSANVPLSLNRIACDITRYYLYNSVDKDSTVYLRYQQRIKQLAEVALGKLSLGLDAAGQKPTEQQVVFVEPGKKVFVR